MITRTRENDSILFYSTMCLENIFILDQWRQQNAVPDIMPGFFILIFLWEKNLSWKPSASFLFVSTNILIIYRKKKNIDISRQDGLAFQTDRSIVRSKYHDFHQNQKKQIDVICQSDLLVIPNLIPSWSLLLSEKRNFVLFYFRRSMPTGTSSHLVLSNKRENRCGGVLPVKRTMKTSFFFFIKASSVI